MKINGRRSVYVEVLSKPLSIGELPLAYLSLFTLESQIRYQGLSVLPDEQF